MAFAIQRASLTNAHAVDANLTKAQIASHLSDQVTASS